MANRTPKALTWRQMWPYTWTQVLWLIDDLCFHRVYNRLFKYFPERWFDWYFEWGYTHVCNRWGEAYMDLCPESYFDDRIEITALVIGPLPEPESYEDDDAETDTTLISRLLLDDNQGEGGNQDRL